MLLTFLKDIFSLPREESEDTSMAEIEEGIHFRGHNLWLLAISMGIACIGLNANSQAAVIGAMLISPLMGPIVGIAFGLSTGHRHLLHLGFKNWFLMVVVALTSSTVYFLISPFHYQTSQLESFKNATVFDCFLALLGGFAWFLGIIRKEAIKVIAGVAVSTACIPPLCTAGFGIATGNWDFFWGGFYFYLINCFFIGVGAWLLSIVLGYQRYYLRRHRNNNKTASIIISLLSVLVLLPSLIITMDKWKNENLSQRSEAYINQLKKSHPELHIISYEPFEKGNEKYLTVMLLNDSTTIRRFLPETTNGPMQDVKVIWQYAPDSPVHSADLKTLQNQVIDLQNQLKTLQAVQEGNNSVQ